MSAKRSVQVASRRPKMKFIPLSLPIWARLEEIRTIERLYTGLRYTNDMLARHLCAVGDPGLHDLLGTMDEPGTRKILKFSFGAKYQDLEKRFEELRDELEEERDQTVYDPELVLTLIAGYGTEHRGGDEVMRSLLRKNGKAKHAEDHLLHRREPGRENAAGGSDEVSGTG